MDFLSGTLHGATRRHLGDPLSDIGDITACTDFQIREVEVQSNVSCEHLAGQTCVAKVSVIAKTLNATTDNITYLWTLDIDAPATASFEGGNDTSQAAVIWVTAEDDPEFTVSCVATEVDTGLVSQPFLVTITTNHKEIAAI